jgi:hypothetical protein
VGAPLARGAVARPRRVATYRRGAHVRLTSPLSWPPRAPVWFTLEDCAGADRAAAAVMGLRDAASSAAGAFGPGTISDLPLFDATDTVAMSQTRRTPAQERELLPRQPMQPTDPPPQRHPLVAGDLNVNFTTPTGYYPDARTAMAQLSHEIRNLGGRLDHKPQRTRPRWAKAGGLSTSRAEKLATRPKCGKALGSN